MKKPHRFIEGTTNDRYAVRCDATDVPALPEIYVPADLTPNLPPMNNGSGPRRGPSLSSPAETPQLHQIAHRALRGRYWIAISLGLLFGAAGAVVGWKLGKPVYRGEGLVRIAYRSPPVMKQVDDNVPVEVFDAFLQSQRLLINSRRLLEVASQDPALRAVPAAAKQTVSDMSDNLKVEQKTNADYLQIAYVDRDPVLAAATVRAVISAYATMFRAQNDEFQQHRLEVLSKTLSDMQTHVSALETQLREVCGDAAYVDIEKSRDSAAKEMEQLRSVLTDYRIALIMASQRPAAVTGAASRPGAEQAALNDPLLRDLIQQRIKREDELADLRLKGYGPEMRDMISAQHALDTLQERIAAYMAKVPSTPQTPAVAPGAPQSGVLALAGRPIEELKAEEAGIEKLYNKSKQDLAVFAGKTEKSDRLRAEIARVNTDLSEVSARKRALEMEGGLGARLSILSAGETPMQPYLDRRIPKAAMGGVAGATFPAAVIILVGWLSTRFRYSEETEDDVTRQSALLGIVPALPKVLADREQAAAAAESVHHIRVMLQLSRPGATGGVFMVTSSSASEGKTSLTVALGMSYAAAGCKTLLIDCDPVGRALTRGFTAEGMSGFQEALQDGELRHFVKEASTGLCVLPVGNANEASGWTVSPESIRKLLAEARRQFDVILVDTGPVLGGVVASIVAPAVDNVIFVIARGVERPRVERAIRYIDSIGGRLAGCVFNRAKFRDFERSTSKSMRSPATQLAARRVDPELKGFSAFGPLVECVSAFVPAAHGA